LDQTAEEGPTGPPHQSQQPGANSSNREAANQAYVPSALDELQMHELPVEFVKNDDPPPTYEQVTSKL
jgi:hypothetical protein